jgi:hypothetical protein
MIVNVKDHIQVVQIPANYDFKELTQLSDDALLAIAQADKDAKYYSNLHSFQMSLNLDLVDTEGYWTFFIDV